VLVTHDPDLARVAHMSIALRDGRVVSKTTNRIPGPGSRIPDPGLVS